MNAKTAICAAVFGIFALLPTLAAGSGSATPKDADKHQSAFNDSRIKFLESSFKRLLEKSGSVSGALCLAENGKHTLDITVFGAFGMRRKQHCGSYPNDGTSCPCLFGLSRIHQRACHLYHHAFAAAQGISR